MPDVREKLVELLGNLFCGDYGVNGCDSCKYNTEAMCSAYACADHLIANGVTIQRWIPVEERLPEDDLPKNSMVKQIKVLTALKSDKGARTVRSQLRYRMTWYTSAPWAWKCSGSEITHWAPLPEPPKEE